MATNGKRNRTAGHNFERELAEFFRGLGFSHVVTARSESKSRDDDKIDLMNTQEGKNGRFVFNVQAKNTTGHVKYAKLLAEMPNEDGVINIVMHKQTEKNSSGRFIQKGKYVIMSVEDFEKMIKLYNAKGVTLTPETFIHLVTPGKA